MTQCEWCNTVLRTEIEPGKWLAFTAHTDEFCRIATRRCVKDLRAAIVWQRENFEHVIRRHERSLQQYLEKHGLPTADEKLERARGLLAAQRADLIGFPRSDPSGSAL